MHSSVTESMHGIFPTLPSLPHKSCGKDLILEDDLSDFITGTAAAHSGLQTVTEYCVPKSATQTIETLTASAQLSLTRLTWYKLKKQAVDELCHISAVNFMLFGPRLGQRPIETTEEPSMSLGMEKIKDSELGLQNWQGYWYLMPTIYYRKQ